MGSSETTISGPKTCQAILKIRLQKKSTNTKIVGIEIMKPSYLRDHPFKTSACLRGGGVKNLPNLPTDSTKKLPTVGG